MIVPQIIISLPLKIEPRVKTNASGDGKQPDRGIITLPLRGIAAEKKKREF